MRQNILKGTTQPTIFKNCGIDGFNVDAKLIADAVNTQPQGAYLAIVKIKAILRQGGIEAEIINGNLLQIVEHTAIAKAKVRKEVPLSCFTTTTAGLTTGFITKTETASIAGEQHIPLEVYTGPLVLKGNDSLEVIVEVPTDVFDSSCDAASYFVVTENRAIVNQLFVPVIKQIPVPANEAIMSKDLGDNVQNMTLHVLDKASSAIPKAFTNVKFSSDRLTYDRNYNEVYSDYYKSTSLYKNGTYILSFLNGVEHDAAKVQFDLVSTDITSGKVFLVYSGFYVNGSVLEAGMNRKNKHARRNAMKLS